ncbi:MAG: hypothetical protein J5I81_01425 [Nitrococcus mobilis]|nr:hypothetical protein [Nitrococcus mobilis]
MYANAYHYLQTFTIVQDDLLDGQFAPAVLDQLRGSARRRFLEQLGAHRDRLAQQGLRLRIRGLTRSKSLDLGPGDIVAVTQLLERLEEEMLIVESVYAVTRDWKPLCRERIRVRVEDHCGQPRLPESWQESARKWLGLIRGLTPTNGIAAQCNSQS